MSEETNVDEVQISRILHYVIKGGRCKPAIVEDIYPQELGKTNLVVFNLFSTSFIEEVLPNHQVKSERTWHWPRECIHLKEADNA